MSSTSLCLLMHCLGEALHNLIVFKLYNDKAFYSILLKNLLAM